MELIVVLTGRKYISVLLTCWETTEDDEGPWWSRGWRGSDQSDCWSTMMTHSFYWEQHTHFGLDVWLELVSVSSWAHLQGLIGRRERNVSARFWNKVRTWCFLFKVRAYLWGFTIQTSFVRLFAERTHCSHQAFLSWRQSLVMTSQLKANLREANRILHTINNRSRLWKENKRRLEVLKLWVKLSGHLRDWRGDDATVPKQSLSERRVELKPLLDPQRPRD